MGESKKQRAIMVYACDMRDGQIGIATQSRSQKTIRYLCQGHGSWTLYLAAGRGLKEVMLKYFIGQFAKYHFVAHGNDPYELQRDERVIRIILADTEVFGSYPETGAVAAMLERDHFSEITVITGLNHMARVKHIWKKYFPQFRPHFVPSPMEYRWTNILEPLFLGLTLLGFKTR